MAEEEDIMEINEDVFDESKSRRRRRCKDKSQDDGGISITESPVLREDTVMGSEDASVAAGN